MMRNGIEFSISRKSLRLPIDYQITQMIPKHFYCKFRIGNNLHFLVTKFHGRSECMTTNSNSLFFNNFSFVAPFPENQKTKMEDETDEAERVVETDPTGRFERFAFCLGKGAYKEVFKVYKFNLGV